MTSSPNFLPSPGKSNKYEEPSTGQSLTFAFEHVAARLEPFDFYMETQRRQRFGEISTQVQGGINALPLSGTRDRLQERLDNNRNIFQNQNRNNAMGPIYQTGGLVFPYNPTISEGVSVKYDNIELTHSNESYYAYRATDNVRINISDAVWTCDTFENAVYALSVLHFLRSYSLMDFGRGNTGRPPSPMWFSAFGNYAYYRVPVLMEKADWSFPNDVDYVGIPEPGTPEYQSRSVIYTKSAAGGNYTWLPIQFKVSGISLIVQHSPRFWLNFSLDDYRSGLMLEREKSFHAIRRKRA